MHSCTLYNIEISVTVYNNIILKVLCHTLMYMTWVRNCIQFVVSTYFVWLYQINITCVIFLLSLYVLCIYVSVSATYSFIVFCAISFFHAHTFHIFIGVAVDVLTNHHRTYVFCIFYKSPNLSQCFIHFHEVCYDHSNIWKKCREANKYPFKYIIYPCNI